jgi:hypothetical protein
MRGTGTDTYPVPGTPVGTWYGLPVPTNDRPVALGVAGGLAGGPVALVAVVGA